MTTENLTTYTITGSHMSADADTVTWTALQRNEVSDISYDFGAGYFSGRAYWEGRVQVSASTGSAGRYDYCGFSDAAGAASAWSNAAGTYFNVPNADPTVWSMYAWRKDTGAGAKAWELAANSKRNRLSLSYSGTAGTNVGVNNDVTECDPIT